MSSSNTPTQPTSNNQAFALADPLFTGMLHHNRERLQKRSLQHSTDAESLDETAHENPPRGPKRYAELGSMQSNNET